jgi:hypothetical protein
LTAVQRRFRARGATDPKPEEDQDMERTVVPPDPDALIQLPWMPSLGRSFNPVHRPEPRPPPASIAPGCIHGVPGALIMLCLKFSFRHFDHSRLLSVFSVVYHRKVHPIMTAVRNAPTRSSPRACATARTTRGSGSPTRSADRCMSHRERHGFDQFCEEFPSLGIDCIDDCPRHSAGEQYFVDVPDVPVILQVGD